jgi:hypothetical protein
MRNRDECLMAVQKAATGQVPVKMPVKDRKIQGVAFLLLGVFCFFLYSQVYEYILAWERETPVSFFLFDRQFLAIFLPIPGGCVHYAGRFFGQFYEFTALGALVAALLVTVLGVLLHRVLRRLMAGAALFCALLPCVVLATTLSSGIPEVTVGLIASAGPFVIYLHLPKGRARRIYALLAMPVLYLLAGSCLWLFAFWVAASEWLEGKPSANLAWKLLWPVLAVSLPVIAWRWLFLVPLRSAFLSPAIFGDARPLPAALLYGYLALMPFWAWAFRKLRIASVEGSKRNLAMGTALLALTAGVCLWFCYEPRMDELVTYHQLYRQKRWDDILSKTAGKTSTGLVQQFFTNCALYHKGRLLDEMFRYPQRYGPRGLIPNFPRTREGANDDTCLAMYNSDLFFEMGHVNMALRLAFVDTVLFGRTYQNVSRMAECSLANGDCATAAKYVTLLDRTLFHREFARRCKRLLAEAKARDEYFAPVRARMPTVDLPMSQAGSFVPLLALVQSHPDNRMAFDYLIAWNLLEEQAFPMLPDYLRHLKDAGYNVLPVHVQEALLTYEKWSGRAVEIPGFGYDPKTKARFFTFLERIGRAANGAAGRPEPEPSLWGSYMYYRVFLGPHDTCNYGMTFWRLGKQFEAMGINEEALAHYRCAAWLCPQIAEAHLSLADLLKKESRLEEADIEYGRARRSSSSSTLPSSRLKQDVPVKIE